MIDHGSDCFGFGGTHLQYPPSDGRTRPVSPRTGSYRRQVPHRTSLLIDHLQSPGCPRLPRAHCSVASLRSCCVSLRLAAAASHSRTQSLPCCTRQRRSWRTSHRWRCCSSSHCTCGPHCRNASAQMRARAIGRGRAAPHPFTRLRSILGLYSGSSGPRAMARPVPGLSAPGADVVAHAHASPVCTSRPMPASENGPRYPGSGAKRRSTNWGAIVRRTLPGTTTAAPAIPSADTLTPGAHPRTRVTRKADGSARHWSGMPAAR